MARPSLKLPLPEQVQGEPQLSPASPLRSPRFIEDFDAPFSEAFMNASRTTLATDTMSYPSTVGNSRTSFGTESVRRPSFGNNRQPSAQHTQSQIAFHDPSWESEAKRRSTVNDRILEWAKKSWSAVRPRSGTKGSYTSESDPSSRRKSSAMLPPSPSNASTSDVGRFERANSYAQAVVTQVQKPRAH